MMKLIVEIDCPLHTLEEFNEHRDAWFPLGPDRVSVDKDYLNTDPTDDSFVLFKFIEAKEG